MLLQVCSGFVEKKIWKDFSNFWLEKPLSTKSLVKYYGNVEDNAESSENVGNLTLEISQEKLKVL